MSGNELPATLESIQKLLARFESKLGTAWVRDTQGVASDRALKECWGQVAEARGNLMRAIEAVCCSPSAVARMEGRDMDAAAQPCGGCGKPLLIENAWMEDGCPCNTPSGVNNLNLYRWRLLHELQQRQNRELEARQAKIDRLMLEHCPDEMTPEQTAEWAKHQKPVNDAPSPIARGVPAEVMNAIEWIASDWTLPGKTQQQAKVVLDYLRSAPSTAAVASDEIIPFDREEETGIDENVCLGCGAVNQCKTIRYEIPGEPIEYDLECTACGSREFEEGFRSAFYRLHDQMNRAPSSKEREPVWRPMMPDQFMRQWDGTEKSFRSYAWELYGQLDEALNRLSDAERSPSYIERGSGWQPIATAPRDGRTILLRVPTRHAKWNEFISVDGHWEERDPPTSGFFVIYNADEALQRVEPTHWWGPNSAPSATRVESEEKRRAFEPEDDGHIW